MTAILRRHEAVRNLFDNRWLHLFALDEDGRVTSRYAGNLNWQSLIANDADDTRLKAQA